MRDAAPQTIYLTDYAPPPVHVRHVDLRLRLDPQATRVITRLTCERRAPGPMVLDGEDLRLISLRCDGAEVAHSLSPTALTLPDLPDQCTLEIEVEIAPARNTALEGLYMSNGIYCTQCEAEGFRKITYMLDRPDVMATYSVRIEGDAPLLLSNGNPTAAGPGWAEWHDPHPKPTYLFALVAGDLRATSAQFTTMEGREVALNIYVRPGDEAKTAYAMDALIRSMKWDEAVYGRAYDLEVFNIVAVDDFNMGAMENKGLNLFNSKYVLASPETATDTDYALIEGIIAHEYFHNWTGNRITCRDWFQLCLKEGLTVFRDQQFSADMRSGPVQRISDVLALRGRQFREDAGPLAHPVRPESFVEINNFYTATVYEKGAELIGMLRTLVGSKAYDAALTLYFNRHDGQACTIEDWLKVFEDSTGRDLTQFKRWYSQAGTPRVSVDVRSADGKTSLTFRQETRPTPGQPDKAPQVIPIAYGLLSPNGDELLAMDLLEMTQAEVTVTHDINGPVVPSILRGFSAPVILDIALSDADRITLMAHDSDPFNRWEAARSLAKSRILARLWHDTQPDGGWMEAVLAVLSDSALDPAFRALCLELPSEDDLAQACVEAARTPDPWEIRQARDRVARSLAQYLESTLRNLINEMETGGAYSPAAKDAGKRALKNACLRLLTQIDPGPARAAYGAARNMTDQLAAFGALLSVAEPGIAATFEAQWRADRLVMDKWFALQVSESPPAEAVATAQALSAHPDFEPQNPNRFRALIGGLTAGNPAGFHDPSGAGYRFVADWLLTCDAKNPQTAARMSTAFDSWRRYDADRQGLIEAQLQRMRRAPGLSRDLTEMLDRMLAS